ncbi:nucleotidyltransferase domain-containing protein [Agrobacterium sp. 22-3674b3]|nr:nucleotidyltransferase domain-containing protein [Agrobacterium tumefaciens]
MDRIVAIRSLKKPARAIKGIGATRPYLFGSTARDGAGSSSDLDVFID